MPTQRKRVKDMLSSIHTHLDYSLKYLKDLIELYDSYGYSNVAEALLGVAGQLIVIQKLLDDLRDKI